MADKYKEYIKPIIVLIVICLIVSLELALTNSVTAPVIEAAELAQAEADRREMLPSAEDFALCECDIDGVESVYADTAGSGYVIVAVGKGYGGNVPVTVALDADGTVLAVRVGSNSETAGVGSRATEQDYLQIYQGVSGSADNVDALSGASITSRAVRTAVNAALAACEQVKGGDAQ